VRDYSRTRFESRILFPDQGDGDEGWDSRRFSLLDVTSGLPEDSREAEERDAARRLADLRGRVKRARAVIARTPGLFELLAASPEKTVLFCARSGITERMLLRGVESDSNRGEDAADTMTRPIDASTEPRARDGASIPGVGDGE
jgi:hypothetical protein